MPRKGEGRSIRIEPDVYERLISMKRGRQTVSDVISELLLQDRPEPEPEPRGIKAIIKRLIR